MDLKDAADDLGPPPHIGKSESASGVVTGKNPGSDGTMTVRSRASASSKGIHRGNPPKPARKPSFGPSPFFHTRQEKPLTSTVSVSGSLTTAP